MSHSVVELFQRLARNEFGFFARLQTVAELMIPGCRTISSEATLNDVLGRQDPLQLPTRPVVDSSKGDVIGLLRNSTVLRCLPRYLNTLKENERDRNVLSSNVCDLMTRRTTPVSPTAPPLAALEIMVREQTDCVLVYDDPRKLAGVITASDFARAMLLYYQVYPQVQPLQRLRLVDLDSELSMDEIFCRGAQTVRDVMNSPVAISAREPVAAAVRAMHENHTHFVALLEDGGHLSNVVSFSDVLNVLQPPARPHLLDHSSLLPALDELLATGLDPALSEPVSNIAKSRLQTASPTTRLSETLHRLLESPRDAVMVVDNNQLTGVVSMADIVRIFRTLMRLQTLKGTSCVATRALNSDVAI